MVGKFLQIILGPLVPFQYSGSLLIAVRLLRSKIEVEFRRT
jgi:hypothetical protein